MVKPLRYKKYFYALRPLLCARWVREHGTVPPMRFAELATALLTDEALLDELNALLAKKMRAGESATSAPLEGAPCVHRARTGRRLDLCTRACR